MERTKDASSQLLVLQGASKEKNSRNRTGVDGQSSYFAFLDRKGADSQSVGSSREVEEDGGEFEEGEGSLTARTCDEQKRGEVNKKQTKEGRGRKNKPKGRKDETI